MQIRSVGVDLGRTTFHLVALGDNGEVLFKKKFTQKQLITFTANMRASVIGDGGVFWRALSRPRVAGTRPRCEADISSVCEAFCEVEQELLP